MTTERAFHECTTFDRNKRVSPHLYPSNVLNIRELSGFSANRVIFRRALETFVAPSPVTDALIGNSTSFFWRAKCLSYRSLLAATCTHRQQPTARTWGGSDGDSFFTFNKRSTNYESRVCCPAEYAGESYLLSAVRYSSRICFSSFFSGRSELVALVRSRKTKEHHRAACVRRGGGGCLHRSHQPLSRCASGMG